MALIGPILGANPIEIQILSQVFNVFVLPAVVGGIIMMANNQKIMKGYQTGLLINIGLWAAFIFAIVISYNGILGILEL